MSMKKMALIALASTALAVPAYASDAEIAQLTKEINSLKAKVNELSKKSAAAPAAAASSAPTFNYVKTCEAYGDGFFVIPGTSSCLRLSGYARAEASYVPTLGNQNDTTNVTNSGKAILEQQPLGFAGRVRLNTDFRSSTDMGTLRGFGRLNLNVGNSTAYGNKSDGSAIDDQTTSFGTTADLEYAYVTLGGWSVGRQDSAFSFYSGADSSDLTTTDDKLKILAASYTLPVASGLSATAAIENPIQRSIAKQGDLGIPSLPEFVGSVQMINGPATIKLSGALHQVVSEKATDDGTSKQGYAYQGGVKYVVSPETTLWLQGTYAKGAMSYLGYGIGNNKRTEANNPAEEFRVATTAISGDASDNLDLSSGWSVMGAMNQKLGMGNLALIVVYGDIDNNRRIGDSGAVYGSLTQYEANYTFKPYLGLNIQPAVAYQKWDMRNGDTSDNGNAVDADRFSARVRVWREF